MCFVFYFIFLIFHFCYFYFTLLIKEIPRIFHLWSVQLASLQPICRRRNKHFDFHLRGIRTVHFLSKDGQGASYDRRDGWKGCLFHARVGIFDFDVIMYRILFPICTLTWRVNNYVSRQDNVKIGEMKVQKTQVLLFFCSTDENIQYCWFTSLF